MRGDEGNQDVMFSYVKLERRVPSEHPLRAIRAMADMALRGLDGHFAGLYARGGRPSIAPERLIRAQLLQVLYSVRSERQMGGGIAEQLLLRVVEQARSRQLLSEEHFTVDGTLIQAWASRRSFKEKSDPPTRGSGTRGRKLLRDTHESTTDGDARLYKKSGAAAAVPCYLGHLVTENRNGLIVGAMVTQASKTAEGEAALMLMDGLKRGQASTLGADKGYQQQQFVEGLRARNVVPHVAEYEPNPRWPNWLTEAERSSQGFAISQSKRKLVEKVFGWAKQDRALRQVKLRGKQRVEWMFRLVAAAHNLLRMRKLIPVV